MTVLPGTLSGSGQAKIGGKAVCIDGDEKNVKVENCDYTAGNYSGGKGTLMIDSLRADQKAQKTNTGGKAVLLKGSTFTATFEVGSTTKGIDTNGESDPTTTYSGGSGTFSNNNTTVKGS